MHHQARSPLPTGNKHNATGALRCLLLWEGGGEEKIGSHVFLWKRDCTKSMSISGVDFFSICGITDLVFWQPVSDDPWCLHFCLLSLSYQVENINIVKTGSILPSHRRDKRRDVSWFGFSRSEESILGGIVLGRGWIKDIRFSKTAKKKTKKNKKKRQNRPKSEMISKWHKTTRNASRNKKRKKKWKKWKIKFN